MTQVAVIINPAAGGGRAGRCRHRLEKDLGRSGLGFTTIITRDETHMRRQIHACAERCAWLLIVGGDTSFRIAATELLLQSGKRKELPSLAFFGAGSANDVVHALGIRGSRHLCELIRDDRVGRMDVGWVRTESPREEHLFLGSMSLGLGVRVNREMARTRGQSGRPVAAWIPGAAALRRAFAGNELPMRLTVNGRSGRYSLVAVMNGPRYAGGLRIAPDASVFDHRLDLVLLSTRGWPGTMVAAAGVVAGRRLPVETADEWRIEAENRFSIQVDGDVFPSGKSCTVGVHAAALKVAAARG